jgi:hypothetical protein
MKLKSGIDMTNPIVAFRNFAIASKNPSKTRDSGKESKKKGLKTGSNIFCMILIYSRAKYYTVLS